MPNFIQKLSGVLNGFEITVHEVDLDDQKELIKLKEYLKSKVRSMKVHNVANYVSQYLAVPGLKKEFIEALEQRIKEINTPAINNVAWFDVRRSRVTEFMSI